MKIIVNGNDGGLHLRTIKKKDIVEMPIEDIPTDYIEHWKLIYQINEDLLGHLMKWDDIDNVPIKGWEEIRRKIHEENINIRRIKGVYYRKRYVNIFEKYTIDELKKLYENNGLWSATEYFVNYLNQHNNHVILQYENNDEGKQEIQIEIKNANYNIQNEYYRSDKELSDLITKSNALQFILQLYEEDGNNHSDMYDFVINNLQYASIEDLKKLCKLNSEHFLIKGKGRKSKNKKIFKYDLKHNLLKTYVNRNACIDAEQISKQALYNVLSGKRKQLKGFIYEEEQ